MFQSAEGGELLHVPVNRPECAPCFLPLQFLSESPRAPHFILRMSKILHSLIFWTKVLFYVTWIDIKGDYWGPPVAKSLPSLLICVCLQGRVLGNQPYQLSPSSCCWCKSQTQWKQITFFLSFDRFLAHIGFLLCQHWKSLGAGNSAMVSTRYNLYHNVPSLFFSLTSYPQGKESDIHEKKKS